MAEPRGIDFPFRADTGGFPEPADGLDLIGASIKQILLTELGERLMRPTFGSRIREYLFENIDDVLLEVIRAEVARAILANEPRVLLISVDVRVELQDRPETVNVVVIEIFYDRYGRRSSVQVSFTGTGVI